MIDLYEIQFSNRQLGLEDWKLQAPSDSGDAPGSHLRRKRPNHHSWMAQQKATLYPKKVRIKVCPPKVLGRWNVYGTDDLRDAVLETAPLALKALGIAVTSEIIKLLQAGDYIVREVHIAHQFHLKRYSISDFILSLFRQLNDSSRSPQWIPRGYGFFLEAASRTLEYLFYDKLNEFRNEALPEYRARVAAFSGSKHNYDRFALNIERSYQHVLASCGPRLEQRFGDHFFLINELSYGYNWRPNTADDLYQKYLLKLKLPRTVSPVHLRDRARGNLSSQIFKTYLLWAAGYDLEDAGLKEKTLRQHRLAIRKSLNIDVKHPASAMFSYRGSVNPARVFSWDNRVIAEKVDFDSLIEVAYDSDYMVRR